MDNPYYELLVNAAIRYVSFRPRSVKELTDFLNKKLTRWKQPGAGLLAKVISRMEDLGYADDAKFAAWWVDQRTNFKPKGNRYIQMELRGKGVPEAVIVTTLASRGSVSLLGAARQAVAKKMPIWSKLPVLARKKKLYDYLGRRGFDYEIIRKLIDESK
jgi:regulatory protein